MCDACDAFASGPSPIGLLATEAPRVWHDQNGREWITPTIIGRLKPAKIPAHGALREFVLWRDGYRCRACGSHERLVADHVISRRNGGAHHPHNMQALCDSCNARKVGLYDARRAMVS